MTKIATYGDLHAHKFSDFSEVDEVTGNSRFTDILNCLKFIREYCLKNNIKYVLDEGDTFHKRKAVETDVMNGVYNEIKAFSDAGLEVIMIPGNHSQIDNTDYPDHSLETFKDITNVTVLDRYYPHQLWDGDDSPIIYPVPYSKNAEMVKKAIDKYAYQTTNEGLEDRSILLAHLGVSGAYVGKSSYAMQDAFAVTDLFPHAFRFVACGHYHRYQELGGFPHVFYSGAPIMHNFNDEGEDKGFVVMDMETGTKEFIPIPSPKFMTVEVNNETNIDEIRKELTGNFIRFRVNAEDMEELAQAIPAETKYRLEVQKTYDTEKRVDVDFSMSFEEIISKYAKEFKPEAEAIGLEIFRESQSR